MASSPSSFASILRFMERFAPDVHGHGEEDEAALHRDLAAFAEGGLTGEKHGLLVQRLASDAALRGKLAEIVRARRAGGPKRGRPKGS